MRASTAGPPATTSVARKIAQKRQELEGVLALQQATELFMKRIEGMCADVDCLADASIVMGRVLEQWPQMFKVLGLLLEAQEALGERMDENTLKANPVGERLVRFPIEELQVLHESANERSS